MTRWGEAAVAGISAALTALMVLPLPTSAFAAALAFLVIGVAVIDLEQFIIPDSLNLTIFLLGLIWIVTAAPDDEVLASVVDGLLRSGIAAAALWAIGFLYRWRSGIDGLGLGDVKLIGAGAPWLGWSGLPLMLAAAALAALGAVAVDAAVRRRWPSRRSAAPFGAFLAPAIWIVFMIEQNS